VRCCPWRRTDLQTASEGSKEYDADFLSAADVVFVSHEKLPVEPKDFVSSIWERSVARIAVVGMGAAGALLGVRGREVCQVRAVKVRPVANTVGAGDALFSPSFTFTWMATTRFWPCEKRWYSPPTRLARVALRLGSWRKANCTGCSRPTAFRRSVFVIAGTHEIKLAAKTITCEEAPDATREVMKDNYAARTHEFDRVYAKPERQNDLRHLENWLPTVFS
jgi:hypothetical protein